MKKLGFGMMRLPMLNRESNRNVDIYSANMMVQDFIYNGFTYFDTAYMYHTYTSELVVKDTLVRHNPRRSFLLADKMPTMFLKCKEDLPRIFEEQLVKCGVDYFDNYMMHCIDESNYDSKAQAFGGFEFIAEKKAEGLVRNIGFSFHGDAQLLDRVLTDHPEVDFVQLQINYLDWDDETIQSGKCYETARRHGKKIIVMEPVRGGSLINIPESAKLLFKSYAPDMSVASWAIRFAASLPGVEMVLSGMSNKEQLYDNMSYMKDFKPLCKEEYDIIDKARKIIRGAVEVPCTSCRYCVDAVCPMNIEIPKIFTLYNADKLDGASGERKSEYKKLIETTGAASSCIGCANCEGACPQHIEIRKFLAAAAGHFEK